MKALTENTEITVTARTAAAIVIGLLSMAVSLAAWGVTVTSKLDQLGEQLIAVKGKLLIIENSTGEICRDLIRDNPQKKDWLRCY